MAPKGSDANPARPPRGCGISNPCIGPISRQPDTTCSFNRPYAAILLLAQTKCRRHSARWNSCVAVSARFGSLPTGLTICPKTGIQQIATAARSPLERQEAATKLCDPISDDATHSDTGCVREWTLYQQDFERWKGLGSLPTSY